MSAATADAAVGDDRLVRQLKWARFVVRLVGAVLVVLGATLTATMVWAIVAKPVELRAGGALAVMLAFALDIVIGVGLLRTAEIARRAGTVWFLLCGTIWVGALIVSPLSHLRTGSFSPAVAAYALPSLLMGALHVYFGVVLLPRGAAFVCRYIGRGAITESSVLDALRRARDDRSQAVRRFSARELQRAGADSGAPVSESSESG